MTYAKLRDFCMKNAGETLKFKCISFQCYNTGDEMNFWLYEAIGEKFLFKEDIVKVYPIKNGYTDYDVGQEYSYQDTVNPFLEALISEVS